MCTCNKIFKQAETIIVSCSGTDAVICVPLFYFIFIYRYSISHYTVTLKMYICIPIAYARYCFISVLSVDFQM